MRMDNPIRIAAAPGRAAFAFTRICSRQVFNMRVENSVEKPESIFVSASTT